MRPVWKASILLLATALTGQSQESEEPVSIHGFGSSAYGRTDGNSYVVGSEEGAFQSSQFALALGAELSDRLRISSQCFLAQDGSEFEATLDYAFAEWRVSDRLRLRAGRAKLPFGLYTEIFDVGTLRPFVTLPQGVYGPAAIVAEGYNGLGLTGRSRAGRGWALQYDLYGGGIDLKANELAGEEIETESIRDMLGGRFLVETPVRGLSLGASGYTGREGLARHSSWGLQGQYLAEPWSVRAEYVRLRSEQGLRVSASYLEVARRFGAGWQAAARYDWSHTHAPGIEAHPSLARHADVAVGLGYWFQGGFVLKLSYHRVDGNRFARPAEGLGAALSGGLEPRTDLLVVGAQFAF